MSLRDDIADIIESLDGSDYMDISDAIIAHLTTTKHLADLRGCDRLRNGGRDER